MSDNIYLLLAILPLLMISFGLIRRPNPIVYLTHWKFWDLVESQEKPVVLRATKGWWSRKHYYVFPYQGVLFYTEIGDNKGDRPKNLIIIKTENTAIL